MEKRRRTGVAALVLMFLSLITTGCLSSRRYQKDCSTCSSGCGSGGCGSGGAVTTSGMSMPGTIIDAKTGRPVSGTIIDARTGRPVPTSGVMRTSFQEGDMVPKDKSGPYIGGPAHPLNGMAPPGPCPTEKAMTSHPPYTVAPPDILAIDAVRLIPKPPYHIEPLEILLINVTDTLPGQPISGPFVVSPEGGINLGFTYGSVKIGGMTLDEAQRTIKDHLGTVLKMPTVTIGLAQIRGMQQVRGQHLVRPDGTISMGTYGAVYVAGLTIGQVKCVIEKHLGEYFLNPAVSVDVFAYNSKFFYVILDGAGQGQQVLRIPSTGNETVLDAIATIQGIAPVSSKKQIWLSRPAPANAGSSQILPVDWQAITMAGQTATNYQLFPGDRLYVQSDCLVRLDNNLAKILAPMERLLGFSLLAGTTVETFQAIGNGGFRNDNGAVFVP